jgi:citrate synthase
LTANEDSADPVVHHGLEGVLAFESEVAYIDGHAPELLIRGYDIADLAHNFGYEQMAYLLLYGRAPSAEENAAFQAELAGQRELPGPVLDFLRAAPETAHPMAVLRTAVSMLGALDPNADAIDPDALEVSAISLIGKFPTIVAAQTRLGAGLAPLDPEGPGLGHADNYLYMVAGTPPPEPLRRAFDAALVLYAEHETNASTFACRVVVGTMSDLYSAVVAGIGAIKGPLHGGAIDDAMNMLVEIGSADRAADYVDAALAAKRKLPGFGHRVYRAGDPRAAELREMALEMAAALDSAKGVGGKGDGDKGGGKGDGSKWIDIAIAAGKRMAETKGIIPNVDYFAAPVLYQLGFPLNLMTNVVASARIAGWSAHIIEQYGSNRLIRPRALYTGERGKRLN